MKILGLDPGTSRIGYGLIDAGRSLTLIDYGVLEITSGSEPEKIFRLGEQLGKLLEAFKPAAAGVEKLYFAKNQKTALAVAQARGVIIYALMGKKIPLFEFRPGDIKKTVTNYGLSDKQAVAKMVKKILRLEAIAGHDDASDALAIAITTAFQMSARGKFKHNTGSDC